MESEGHRANQWLRCFFGEWRGRGEERYYADNQIRPPSCNVDDICQEGRN